MLQRKSGSEFREKTPSAMAFLVASAVVAAATSSAVHLYAGTRRLGSMDAGLNTATGWAEPRSFFNVSGMLHKDKCKVPWKVAAT